MPEGSREIRGTKERGHRGVCRLKNGRWSFPVMGMGSIALLRRNRQGGHMDAATRTGVAYIIGLLAQALVDDSVDAVRFAERHLSVMLLRADEKDQEGDPISH